jgi:hypothetical protein
MMLNLFLDLKNTNFNDEQTLNFKCFTVNNINFINFNEFIHCLMCHCKEPLVFGDLSQTVINLWLSNEHYEPIIKI